MHTIDPTTLYTTTYSWLPFDEESGDTPIIVTRRATISAAADRCQRTGCMATLRDGSGRFIATVAPCGTVTR